MARTAQGLCATQVGLETILARLSPLYGSGTVVWTRGSPLFLRINPVGLAQLPLSQERLRDFGEGNPSWKGSRIRYNLACHLEAE